MHYVYTLHDLPPKGELQQSHLKLAFVADNVNAPTEFEFNLSLISFKSNPVPHCHIGTSVCLTRITKSALLEGPMLF